MNQTRFFLFLLFLIISIRCFAINGNDIHTNDIQDRRNSELFVVYPETIKDVLTIDFGKKLKGKIQIQLMNNKGHMLRNMVMYTLDKNMAIEMKNYPDGEYYIRCSVIGVTQIKKIFKEK